MYAATPVAGAPADTKPVGRLPLPLARVVTRGFPGGHAFGGAAARIITDLGEAYGLGPEPHRLLSTQRTTFTDMVSSLAQELSNEADPARLVVLAHAFPDAEPQWPACYLSHVLPGEPLSFAVADNGLVTPFLALRIAAEYMRADGLRRAVVMILDQASLLRDPSVGDDGPAPAENRVVALEFAHGGALGELSVQIDADTAPASAHAVVRDLCGEAGQAQVVVAGARLAASVATQTVAAQSVVAAAEGLPCTGPWVALAERLDSHPTPTAPRIALIDYDPSMRLLGRCVVDPVGR